MEFKSLCHNYSYACCATRQFHLTAAIDSIVKISKRLLELDWLLASFADSMAKTFVLPQSVPRFLQGPAYEHSHACNRPEWIRGVPMR